MHIVIQGIIHEYKQGLGIYFDNVCRFVPNTHTFIVSPAQSFYAFTVYMEQPVGGANAAASI